MLQRRVLALVSSLLFCCLIFYVPRPGATWRSFIGSERDLCSASINDQYEMLLTYYTKLFQGVTHVALTGFPNHPNKGDAAIWAGEQVILKQLNITTIYDPCYLKDYNATEMRQRLKAHGDGAIIVWHGGGNMNDIWDEQLLRDAIVQDFLDYPIRSFPQTLHFQKQENLDRVRRLYAQHDDLQLAARDAQSFEQMQKWFGKHPSVLLPDAATMLALSPAPVSSTAAEFDMLVHARVDGEGGQDHTGLAELALHNASLPLTFTIDDWLENEAPFPQDSTHNQIAEARVAQAYDFLKRGRVVITDRMHAHILATFWRIPHVAIETGSYKKLERYHNQWLSACVMPQRQSQLVHSLEDAIDVAKTLLGQD